MNKVRALVVTGFGINCEEEMAAAYDLSGAASEIVHLSAVFNESYSIQDYEILNFPGGFSFGDDLGAATVLGNKFKYRRMKSGRFFIDEIQRFLQKGGHIVGVCNGFQALVKMGLLPNIDGNFKQQVSLTYNASGKFEDRWVTCRVNPESRNLFLKDIDFIDLPVRHGEGRLVIGDEKIKNKIIQNNLNCLSYVDDAGKPAAEYPANPNGSELDCAGLTDPTGQILGVMPHPEAYLSLYNHPNWGKKKYENSDISEAGEGLKIFKNLVEKISAG